LLQDKLKLPQKLLILISVPLFFELLFVGSLIVLQRQAELEAASYARSQRIIAETNHVVRLIYEASSAFLIYTITDSPKAAERFKTNLTQIPQSTSTMKELVASDPAESLAAKRIDRLAQRIAALLDKAYQEKLHDSLFWRSYEVRTDIFKMTDTMVGESYAITEQERAKEQNGPSRESHWRNLVVGCLLVGVTGSVLITALLVFVVNQDILKRLAVMIDNVNRLSGQLPLNKPVKGNDEIAQLDATFHRMADALSAATQKERALIENSVDIICSLDSRPSFTALSPSCSRVWQYDPGELIGKPLSKILSPVSLQSALLALQSAMRDNQPFTLENRVLAKNGAPVDTYWTGRWSDKDQSFICIARDTTEQKKIERLKREFVEMVGHDIKTPLMSTELFLTFLASGANHSLPDELRSQAQLAEMNVTRLIRLVKNLLDLERLEAGRLSIERKITSAAKLLERSLVAVQAFAENCGVTIAIPQSRILLYGDEDALVQVLVNLLSNAVKFSESGQVVKVSVSETEREAEFKVTDSGRGIPEDARTRIFDPYEQVDLADQRLKGGSGLGLAICKSIIDMHGGRIGVDSESGKGSTVWFTIPSPDQEDSSPKAAGEYA
jgi:PAS domain S-box-containing protein